MPRRTIPHDRCQPFVVRGPDRLELVMPVIRPDGRGDVLKAEISPAQAAHIASELMAFVSARLATKQHERDIVAASHNS